jgi:hypothetical protein
VRIAARLVAGVGLVGWVVSRSGASVGEAARQAAGVPIGVILGALAIDLGGQSLCALRWWVLGQSVAPEASLLRYWALSHGGMFFNLCLPTSFGGDLVRAVVLGSGVEGRSRALASVLIDRDVGLGGLLLVGGAAALVSGARLTVGDRAWPPGLLYLALGAGYVVVNALLWRGGLSGWAPGRWRAEGRRFEEALRAHAARGRRGRLAFALILSLVYQLSEAALIWWLGRGLGVALSPALAAVLVTLHALAGLLPITVNGLGVREVIFCALLVAGGTARPEQALALSWLWLAVVMASGLAGGLVYVVYRMSDSRQGAPR